MMGREISMCFIVIATVIGNSASLRDNTSGSPYDGYSTFPILEAMLETMQNEMIEAGSSVGGVQNSKRSQVEGQTIGDTISTEAQEIGETIGDTLRSGAQGVGQAMGTVKDALGNGAEEAGQAIGTIKDALGNGAVEAGKAIQTFENSIGTEAKVAGNAIGQVEETIIYETKNATEVVDILVSGVGNSNPTDIVMELVKYAMEHGFPKAFDYFIQYLIKIINPAAQKYLDDKTFKIQDIVAALKDVNFKQILNDIKKLTTKEGLSSALNRVNGHTITCLWDTATICSKQVIKPPALVYCVGKHMLGKGYDCFPDVEKCTRKLHASKSKGLWHHRS